MRQVMKKTISSLLVFVFAGLILFNISKWMPKQTKDEPNIQTSVFNNGFFDYSLNSANINPMSAAEDIVFFEDLQTIIVSQMNTTYLDPATRDQNLKAQLMNIIGSKRVAISTADDLYNFSMAVSYNWSNTANQDNYPHYLTIAYLLDQDYVLVDDIDYSSMKAKKFNPIGIDLDLPGDQDPTYPFTGSFDGQGFSISNLYLSDYNYITMVYSFDDDPQNNQDFSLTKSYSMFGLVGQTGVLKNFTLIDPTYELLDAPEGLTRTSMLVGFNHGTIYNVGVIDTKINLVGDSLAGIRFNVQFSQTGLNTYTAAGFVHTNGPTGKIVNSYFISEHVISPANKFRFNVRPFVYENQSTGIIEHVGFDSLVEPNVDSMVQPSLVYGYTRAEFRSGLKNGNPIAINDTDLSTYNESIFWRFYVLDGYPVLYGLESNSGVLQIENGLDLIIFTKLIQLNTSHLTGLSYSDSSYVIIDDIDMKNYRGYKAPSKPFSGTLSGGTSEFSVSSTNSNKYIYNLSISKPTVVDSNYYMGLFSVLSGTVKNINLFSNQMLLTDTKASYGKVFNIGSIAGVLDGGLVKNVVSGTSIDLNNQAIGRSYVGGIVGLASGSVIYNANIGNIEGNLHDFNNLTINGLYSIGGIVGATGSDTLTLTNSINTGSIHSVGLQENTLYNVASGAKIINRVGGIIGEVNNTSSTDHSLLYLTNEGTINASDFAGKSTAPVENYLGGVFGEVRGLKLTIIVPSGNTYIFRNGRWQNKGTITGKYLNTSTTLYTAGIGVAGTSQAKAEFSYLTNSGTYDFTGYNMGTDRSHMFFSATILDKSSGGIKLSRAYNTRDFTYDSDYFTNPYLLTINTIKIAPFFVSLSNQDSELVYVDNRGAITVGNATTDTEVAHLLHVAGITLESKIDYRNVTSSSNISLLKINNTSTEVFVAGVTYALPYDVSQSRAYEMENVHNEGKIVVADFKGNSLINSQSGTASGSDTFSSSFTSRNLYVAGIVNLNVGRMTNVINTGDITSEKDGTVKDIDGTANTFAGGISTINYNFIQDAANMGKILFTNSSSGNTFISSQDNPSSGGALFAGLVYTYNGGIVLGGISALMADTAGSILTDIGRNASIEAEVLDTSNNGDIYAKANKYVRVGGIMGVALGLEITAGTDNATSSSTVKRFSSNITGAQDPVANSMVSNGLNFGDITGISNTIHTYLTGTSGLAQRPGVYASAGGVIGYGLFRMKRMLNHGTVSSTDVAGGIVGSTYIVGSTSSSSIPTTIVDIDTAVHYGKVKAAKNSAYSSFTYLNSTDYDNTTYYQLDNSSYLFPSGITSRNIANKPGFGGIFGRLQRGTYGLMQSTNFINILNMDENIDMVGRTDQNQLGSFIYYRFSVTGRNDTYYTARGNDTSPATIVGYYPSQTISNANMILNSAASITYRFQRTWTGSTYQYTVISIYASGANYQVSENLNRYVGIYLNPALITYNYITNNANNTMPSTANTTYTNASLSTVTITDPAHQQLSNFGLVPSQISGLSYDSSGRASGSQSNYSRVTPVTGNYTRSESDYKAEVVTDNALDTSKTYIFDDNFPLKDIDQSEYIYEAKIDVLADRYRVGGLNYKSTRQALYVLASTKGKEAGAVLAQNIQINDFFDLDESTFQYIDLDNPEPSKVISDETINMDLLTKYRNMFQLKYSDKSLVLPKNNEPTIADLTLFDPTGNSPKLEGGIIDNVNKTITFNVSQSAFSSSTVNYEIESATLSEKAVIARFNSSIDDFSLFNQAYLARTSNQLSGAYKVEFLNQIFDGNNQIVLPFSVFAEVAAMDANLVDVYQSSYNIIINRLPSTLSISINQVYLDDVLINNPSLSGTTYTVNSQYEMLPNGNIYVQFIDNGGLLPTGHDMTIHYLKKGTTTIDDSFFDYTIYSEDNDYFGFEMSLSDSLSNGTYSIEFSYYNSSTIYTLNFVKATSTQRSVLEVSYPTYSADLAFDLEFTPSETDFTTYIEFGHVLDGVLYQSSRNLSISMIPISTSYDYVNTVDYYELMLDSQRLITVKLSPFATLTDATITYDYDTLSGKKEYYVTYTVLNNGISTPIVHTITERDLNAYEVFKNGNQQFNYPVLVEREALLTAIKVDFQFAYANLYSNIETTITDGFGVYTPMFGEITIFKDQSFEIDINYLLGVGSKNYQFNLLRENGIYYDLGNFDIEKSLGINAYLQDINFQLGSDLVIYYPDMHEINSDGSEVTPSAYDPRVYFEGIDYNNADVNHIQYFRIDGFVSDIDITNYHPEFTLPFGAMIQKQVSPGVWSSDLFDNYISDDETMDRVIRYRILPETVIYSGENLEGDLTGTNIVYYDLTAFDLTYILTIRFTLHFRFSNGLIVDAGDSTSPIKNSAILINIKNYYLQQGVNYEVVTDPITGDITYPYEGNIIDYVGIPLDPNNPSVITKIQNQATMFYFPLPVGYSNYIHTFGRNTTGVYGFSIVAPKYAGPNTETLRNGLRYTYNIYLKSGAEGGTQLPWNHPNYQLPNFDSTGEIIGKYYYTPGSLRQIIREFAIVIEESTIGDQWGLYDDYTSWDEPMI
ncbi:MAG: hypothetical protein RBQ91_07170 [Acholeplasma sp.]|nr:hypothetical protein [Acholeplasma sp.]